MNLSSMNLTLRRSISAVCILMLLSCSNPNGNSDSGQENVNDEKLVESVNMVLLQQMISEVNKHLPMEADEGITLTKMYVDGDYVMYLEECDEDILDIEFLKVIKDGMKERLKTAILMDDPIAKNILNVCKNANKGLGYKYIGNKSEESVVIQFTLDELDDQK